MLDILTHYKSAVFKFSLVAVSAQKKRKKPASSKSLQTDNEDFHTGRTKLSGSTQNILHIQTSHTAFSGLSFYTDTVGSRYVP